ncbi:MAG: hypothetical protein RQ752_00425 [Thermohalobaculum sp.]|nr:hypothetical protein [Thermohalobaculum sp.]
MLRIVGLIVLPMSLSGCVGAVGLAAAGASVLLNAVTGSPGGASPQGLTIDPNKALSDQLARADSAVSPACKATLDRLEPALTAKARADLPVAAAQAAPGPTDPAPVGPDAAPAPSVTGVGGAAPDRGCALRYVCLGGARAPVQMMVCSRADAGAGAEALPVPAPLAGGSSFGTGPGVTAPADGAAPAARGASVPPVPPGETGWRWAPPNA